MTQTKSITRKLLFAIITIAFIAFALGVLIQQKETRSRPSALENGTILPAGLALAPFTLTSAEGADLTNQNLQGKWTMIFFGYTQCPKMCPTTLAALNSAYKVLQTEKIKALPQILFVSVDAKNDTPAKIRTYLNHFNKNFKGATGSKREIAAITKEVGVYAEDISSSNTKVDIAHSGAILVINPHGLWVAALRAPHKGKIIAKDFQAIVDAAE